MRIGIIAAVLLAVVSAHAQTPPSVSGDWTLVNETIAAADGVEQPALYFRLGSHVRIQHDEKTFGFASWTMPIDGEVVTDLDGARWQAKRQTGGVMVTENRGDAAAAANSAHSISFRLMPDGQLSVEITTTPPVVVRTVKSLYARAPKMIVPSPLPGFAGRWTIDESASQVGNAGGWFGHTIDVSLDTKGFSVSGVAEFNSGSAFYPFDGSGLRAPLEARGAYLRHAVWRGTKLVATGMGFTNGVDRPTQRQALRAQEVVITISLATDGALVVEVDQIGTPAHVGYAKKSVYRRAKE